MSNTILPVRLSSVAIKLKEDLNSMIGKGIFDREQRSRGPRNMKGCDGDGDSDGSTVR